MLEAARKAKTSRQNGMETVNSCEGIIDDEPLAIRRLKSDDL
jgi:hypothetical protein